MTHTYEQRELESFEALACLRWMMLQRRGGVPLEPGMREKVKAFIGNHSILREAGLFTNL
ncbi:hypothetical protein [Paenibacillus sp. CAA11]|uniref:hypothetical protein n=1 Tax=Paenibacillus sp. CAA11 TaxID=1532905 RepID=UPI00131F1D57|nr:hypothetical protein [Paenibacillus sp. CAA11]